MNPPGMTPKEAHLYSFVRAYIEKHDGIAPSVREIVSGCGYRSTGNVQRILHQLERTGLMVQVKARHRPRGWFPVDLARPE